MASIIEFIEVVFIKIITNSQGARHIGHHAIRLQHGMDIAAIKNRMKNKFGDKRSNLKIKTGNEIPFMIVFDKLPNNLDEYTVEVTSSSI